MRVNARAIYFTGFVISVTSCNGVSETRGPFLEGPEKFSRPKSCGKISYFMITELAVLFTYYLLININRCSLHTRSFRRIHLTVFRYRSAKNSLVDPKGSQGFGKPGPGPVSRDSR